MSSNTDPNKIHFIKTLNHIKNSNIRNEKYSLIALSVATIFNAMGCIKQYEIPQCLVGNVILLTSDKNTRLNISYIRLLFVQFMSVIRVYVLQRLSLNIQSSSSKYMRDSTFLLMGQPFL